MKLTNLLAKKPVAKFSVRTYIGIVGDSEFYKELKKEILAALKDAIKQFPDRKDEIEAEIKRISETSIPEHIPFYILDYKKTADENWIKYSIDDTNPLYSKFAVPIVLISGGKISIADFWVDYEALKG
ncbi:MAG: hypothetical protein N2578_00720 [Bdellovibrionaceae bacterium]|nr:hypothetical protein [Pseudobdellovibrionaceae bacterium]